MYADTEQELHLMAARIGLKKEWFQQTRLKHYDLLPFRRDKAIELGAIVDNDHKHMKRLLRESKAN